MARRKNQFMDDGSDSSTPSDNDNDDHDPPFDPTDPDEAAAAELFHNPYGHGRRGKKRSREERQEDATYGIWAEEGDEQQRGGGRGVGSSNARSRGGQGGRKTDYLKGQSFVAAGTKPSTSLSKREQEPVDNLAPQLRIEAAAEDEEDVAMEMGSSSSEADGEGEGASDDEPGSDGDEEGGDGEGEEGEDDPAGNDLPPIAGLSRPRSPTPPPPAPKEPTPPPANPLSSLAFAPRGMSAGRGRGRGGLGLRTGIGGGGAGIGAGIGAGAGAGRGGIGSGAAPKFASSGSTLSTVAPSFAPSSSSSSSSTTAPPPSFAPTSTSTSTSSRPPPPPEPATPSGASTPRAGLGSSRSGIGSGSAAVAGAREAGLREGETLVEALRAEVNGPAPAPASTSASTASSAAASPAPEAAPRERRSFLPNAGSSSKAPAPKPAKLSTSETRHFAQLASSGSIGMKLLEKMGWSAGTGLGKERQGIVTPVGEGQKLRRKNEGIREGERSKGALEEERRRQGGAGAADGEGEGGDEATSAAAREAEKERRKKGHQQAWQSARPRREKKAKTTFKTYEEIVAEEGEGEAQQELLVDLTGQALPSQSLSSLPSSALHGAPTADRTPLPELRHNLTLLTTTLTSSLRSLAREGAGVQQRRVYLAKEEARVRARVEGEERKARRAGEVVELVKRVREMEAEASEVLRALEMQAEGGVVDAKSVVGRFEGVFDQLLGEYAEEFEELGLDEVVVGALAPLLRRLWLPWQPLLSPTYTLSSLLPLRPHFRLDAHLHASSKDALLAPSADPYEEEERLAALRRREQERDMSPFEALMWGAWVPKIRTAINNSWSPTDPEPAVSLYTAWSPLLPAFIRDNLLDQLILPKLLSTLSLWSPSACKRGEYPPLHAMVFPWLDVAGERMEGVLDEARRKVRGWVKTGWKPREGVPKGLEVWKEAFPRSDWDSLLLRHVLPSLGAHLRSSFTINPRQQDLAPLEAVLAWKPLLRGSMLSQLIEAEFFPKWGDALYVWLCAEPNLEQVAEWYSWWKSYFPEDVFALSGVARGFRKGLDLMNQAMALGEDAKYRLKKADFSPKHGPSSSAAATPSNGTPRSSSTTTSSSRRAAAPPPSAAAAAAEPDEITFRQIVEELAAAANLVFLPLGKTTRKGQQLFRVSKNVEGKGGVSVYLEDDVVWIAKAGEEYEPVGVEEMVRRAGAGRA
ncbi:hypothetical protein JCM6882_005250 [Rhodosporidiobolus microsporus]